MNHQVLIICIFLTRCKVIFLATHLIRCKDINTQHILCLLYINYFILCSFKPLSDYRWFFSLGQAFWLLSIFLNFTLVFLFSFLFLHLTVVSMLSYLQMPRCLFLMRSNATSSVRATKSSWLKEISRLYLELSRYPCKRRILWYRINLLAETAFSMPWCL